MNTKSKVERYLQQALAPNTRSAYASDLKHFRAWGGTVPATPQVVAQYLADCAGKMKASTLGRRLAAIRHAHVAVGKASPTDSALVKRTLRGIKRVHGSAVKQAAPITLDVLRKLARPLPELDPVRDLRDRCLLLLGFAGGFRRSELVSLRPCDLQITREGVLISVRASKTDPTGKGRVVAVRKTGGRTCPVAVLFRWLSVLRRADPEGAATPLFRSVTRSGRLGAGLTGASVNDILRRRLTHLGIATSDMSAHSLRAGLVTAAAVAGSPLWAIQRQTGHHSVSSVHRYIRTAEHFVVDALRATGDSRGKSKEQSSSLTFRVGVS
ncbi:integrase [Xenophilus aerolatus]|nr:integrase [Xenophilus aerolatus]